MNARGTWLAACVMVTMAGSAHAWDLPSAAAPYKGQTITVVGLDRPSYAAAKKLTPEFEQATGIKVNWTVFPYENTLKEITLNFVSNSKQFDVILSDGVWAATFAGSKWVAPLDTFMRNDKIADPALDQHDFYPIWLASFTWADHLFAMPFDNYAGLLYYNKAMLKAAGFDGPPATWDELAKVYGPKLTDKGKGVFGYALQSARGETQTADAFARFLWPWGGRFLDPSAKKILVNEQGAQDGMAFRQALLPIMPPGIVSDDHSQVVQELAQGRVAMITEWSAFYSTLIQSPIAADLGVAPEPKGPNGDYAAFGGFGYEISAQVSPKQQEAGWLFIQWLTSKEMGRPLIENGAVIARASVDEDPAVQAKFPVLQPMVATWKAASVPDWRPQVQCYPRFSDITSDWGSRIELGQVAVKAGLDSMAKELSGYMQQSHCWGGVNDPQSFIAKYK